jgi:hypothetical protein
MPSSLSTTLHSFFGGSGTAQQGDSLGGLLRRVLPIPGGEEEGPEDQFASWLPYSAYIPEERLFVNRETLGFMLELVPQSGADERMAEILVSLYATCPPARSPPSARCTQLAHQGLPLYGARLQVELKRVRRGQHRQHDDARKPPPAARKHRDNAARGLLSEPRLYRRRPHQLVCAVLQPASHRGSAVDAPAL